MRRAAPRIESDVLWSGDVELAEDCVVAPRGTLRLQPGCRVVSAGGAPRRLIVEGKLFARGSAWRPVLLECAVAAAGGLVRLSRCRLTGREGEGINLYGDGHELDGVEAAGFPIGLFLRDGGARARGLTIRGGATPVVIAAGGRLRWDGGAVDASSPALIQVRGELSARGLTLRSSISTEGGRVELADCRLAGRGGEGLTLRGGGHALDGVELEGFDRGVSMIAGEAKARGLKISCAGAPIFVGAGSRLAWDGGGSTTTARSRPVIVVEGELAARVVILESSISTEGGRVELAGCRLRGRGGEGLTLRGGGHVLEDVALEGFDCGLSLRGGEAKARGLRIKDARTAAVVDKDSRLSWEGGAATGSARIEIGGELTGGGAERELRLEAALSLEGGRVRLSRLTLVGDDGAPLALEELALSDCGSGTVAARDARLSWAGAPDSPRRTEIRVRGEFRARGTKERPFALEASIAADGGNVELSHCRVADRGGTALALFGGRHRMRGVTLEGSLCGLLLRDAEAEARDLTIRRCRAPVVVSGRARLDWKGGGVRIADQGVLLCGGQARVGALVFEDLRRGVRVRRGAAALDGVRCRGVAALIELDGSGFADVRGGDVPGGALVSAGAGHVHLSGPARGAVRIGPAALLCVSPSAVASGALGGPRAFVLATARLPAFDRLYRAAAAIGVRVFSAWARRQKEVVGAWAHRSWVSGGWEAGASDIDLALSAGELSSPRARRWLERAHSLHARARAFFPALGEMLIAEEAEWRETSSAGLPRAREWKSQARLLAGRLPPLPAPTPEAAKHGARAEAALAYTRLMDVCFHPERPEELARRDAAKAALDVLRYLSDEGELGRAVPREEFRARLPSRLPAWARRLRALDEPGRTHRAACELAAAAALHWGRGGAFSDRGAAPAASDGDLRARLTEVDAARRHFDGAARAAVFDTFHRSYLIVEADLPEEALAEGIGGWARRIAACGLRPALPVVLTAPGWELWRGSAVQDFPSALAAWPESGSPRLETAGRAFPGDFRLFWGRHAVTPPAPREAAAALAQASAQLRVTRRLLEREARASRAAAHHLLGRAACIALARRGAAAPDFDLDAAFSALESFAPGPVDCLRRAAAGDWSGFDAAAAELLREPAPVPVP